MKKGKLTVIAGPMFSGKTGKLVGMIDVFTQMGHTVLTVKPKLDNRFGDNHEIHSHDHKCAKALLYNGESVSELLKEIFVTKADKVIFDEVQFFPASEIKQVIFTLRKKGVHVIAAGLLYDYKRRPFGVTPELVGLADEFLELFSVCQKCGSLARHTERVKGGRGQIVIGAADSYIASCEKCHTIYK